MKLPKDPQFPQPPQDGYLPRLVTRLTELFRWVHEATSKKYSGKYTPSFTGVTNVAASTPREWHYLRVDDAVTVWGQLDVDPTAAGLTQLDATLPIASTFSTGYEISGAGASYISGVSEPIVVGGTGTKARINFTAVSTANNTRWVHFSYWITG